MYEVNFLLLAMTSWVMLHTTTNNSDIPITTKHKAPSYPSTFFNLRYIFVVQRSNYISKGSYVMLLFHKIGLMNRSGIFLYKIIW